MSKLIDLTGKKFGKLTVISRADNYISRHGAISCWLCRCDCGTELVVRGSNLKSGHTKSCGCLVSEEDITNKTFNRLTAIKFHHKDRRGKSYWVFRCSCGNEVVARKSSVTFGEIKSCGCSKKTSHVTHGLSKSDLYSVFHAMKQRCFNKNCREYHNYGARGITICTAWLNDSESFFTWALNNGYKKGLTIDRIDNNGNYCPENCRWSTLDVQQRNKRSTRLLKYRGETRCEADWADLYKINRNTFRCRLKRGWGIGKALLTPTRRSVNA